MILFAFCLACGLSNFSLHHSFYCNFHLRVFLDSLNYLLISVINIFQILEKLILYIGQIQKLRIL